MTKSDDKKVPALRFKGFTDDWEQRKLGDLTQKIKSYPISHDAEINTITGTKYIHYGDIHTGKLKRITNEKILPNINDNNYIPLKSGDVIVADASEDYKGIADACVIDLMKEHYKIVSGLHTIVFRPNEKLKSDFLYTYFHTPIFKHYGYRVGTGLKVFGITYNNLSNMEIKLPKIDEQNKVDKIINIVTNIITLQQRKVNDLNSMKSALLQDVFPNTQGIKKIKLSTQEWNLQKISSIFKERNQRNKNGMLLSVSISKGVYPFSENDRKDNSSNDKSNYKEVKINDLAYNSMRMWQGAVGVSKYNGIVSPAYTVITPKKEENPNFYYYYFKNKRMLFNFRQHSQGLTSDTWNLKFPLFEKILIQVPSDKEEEQRISSLFKQIDKSIELSKIQIKKLTSIKQFLLQNMFI